MIDCKNTVRKILLVLIVTLSCCFLYACDNKKNVQTIDISPYFTDESFIYILSGIDFIKEESNEAYKNLNNGDFKSAAIILEQQLNELDDMQAREYLWYSNALAIAYVIMDEQEQAFELMNKVLAFAEEEGADSMTLAALYNNKGNIENLMVQLSPEIRMQDSLNCFFQAAKYARDYEDNKYLELIIKTNEALVKVASVINVHGVELDFMAEKMYEMIEQEREFLGTPQIISVFNYKNLGSLYRRQEKLKKAEKSYRKALEIYDDLAEVNMNLELVKAGIHHEIAISYMDWGKPEKAEEEYDIAISLYESNRIYMKGNLRKIYINKGINCRRQGLYEEGMNYLKKGLEMSSPNSQDEGVIYMNMASNLFARGMYEECVPLELKAYKIMVDYNQPIQEDVKRSLKVIYQRITDAAEQSETSFDEWLEKNMEELEGEGLCN